MYSQLIRQSAKNKLIFKTFQEYNFKKCFHTKSIQRQQQIDTDEVSPVSSLISDALKESKGITTSLKPNQFREWTFKSDVIDTSPHKCLLVIKTLRNVNLRQALTQLEFSKKKSALKIKSMLNRAFSSINHQINQKMKANPNTRPPPATKDHLELKTMIVGKGIYRRDVRYHGKGMSGRVHHPTCVVKVTLREIIDEKIVDLYKSQLIGKKKTDFENLVDMYKKGFKSKKVKNQLSLSDNRLLLLPTPWDKKGWKYLESKKWTNPNCVLKKKLKTY
ncbi:hypothetical protein HK099_003223 [Clydaea vesicula]|uniref:Ribosomal protein L22 n=1 Tax=Clydaea vesicula TaxID=447962 RepID=A0AAD5Y107_9FUNG|nr:hypothetical protein HK099_003223 [Clydaea vesicula]KAJ3382763.1 hypothetical protein HDU92_004569 [Lobulomyces angularis]